MSVPKLIIGERLTLRTLKLTDANDLYKNIKAKRVLQYLSRVPYPYSLKLATQYIKLTQKNFTHGTSFNFGIVLPRQNKVIGLVSLNRVLDINKSAELGYWLAPRHWGKGYMTEAVKLMLSFGFNELRLHRIHANAFEENKGSEKVLKKCGLKFEGKTRDKWYRFGRWRTVVNYSILESEYKKESLH